MVARQRAQQLSLFKVTLTHRTHHVARLHAAASLHTELECGQVDDLANLCGADSTVLWPYHVVSEDCRGLGSIPVAVDRQLAREKLVKQDLLGALR